MIFGYARVSTQDQNLDRQLDLLKEVGVEEIIQEKITGTKADRSELNKLFEKLQKGDVVLITDLTRLGRRTKEGLESVRARGRKGGRKPKLDENKKKAIYELYHQKKVL